MMWVVMYCPVQSWMVSLMGSSDSTAVVARGQASATSTAIANFFASTFIFFLPSDPSFSRLRVKAGR